MAIRASCQWFRCASAILTAIGVLSLSPGWTGPARPSHRQAIESFWRAGVPRPIAVHDGRSTFRLPTSGRASQTLVVVSALTRRRGRFPIRLTARPADGGAVPEPADDGPRRDPDADPRAGTQRPRRRPSARNTRTVGLPPSDRLFHLPACEGDPGDPGHYVAIRGVLKGVGRRVQVYVASEDLGRVARATTQDIITTFDDRIFPKASEHYGGARDVDGDGRLTVLLSSWLDRLGGGRDAVDGFVKAADLDATVPAPFGNRCDMLYLNAGLASGPYLRTVLAHEYMHAVTYTCKTLDQSDATAPGPEEEGWLDEAIAHLAEDSNGFSPANIDYRVSAFLSAPERYELVVDDYFAANRFRTHGTRGSTYLFLRWCVDRYGAGLIPRLVRSSRRGVENLEAATGAPFADLFRRWTLALFLCGEDASTAASGSPGYGYTSINLRAPWTDWELAGPRYHRVVPGGPADCWEASATSTHYALIDGDAGGGVDVEVSGPPDAELQVTAMAMGPDRARVSMAIESPPDPDGAANLVVRISEQNGIPIRLSALSWEPLLPGPPSPGNARRPARLDMLGIATAFGTSALPARGELRSGPIPLPGLSPSEGAIVIKLVGTDPAGHRVAAWADLPLSARARAESRPGQSATVPRKS